jgi:hypothetical protein
VRPLDVLDFCGVIVVVVFEEELCLHALAFQTKMGEEKQNEVLVPTKSAGDNREYRHVELSNGLCALLIHDADTDKVRGAILAMVCRPSQFRPEPPWTWAWAP